VKLRKVTAEAKLLLIGIPVLIWTMLPIYHLFLFAISPKDQAMGGQLWPDHPTLHNFEVVFQQQHHYLNFFWLQLWNSLVIAVAAGAIIIRQRKFSKRFVSRSIKSLSRSSDSWTRVMNCSARKAGW